MINVTVTGAGAVIFELRHTAERVADRARSMMKRAADRVVKNAKLNAPVDTHNLEESIHIEKSYSDTGRLQIDIAAGGEVNGVNVDQYAAIIHENYESMNPGPGTIAKRTATPGHYVGGKFLERALTDEESRLSEAMISTVRAAIAGEGEAPEEFEGD